MTALRRTIRVVISLGLFVLVLGVVGARDVAQSFLTLSPLLLTGAFGMVLIDSMLRSANMFQLLNRFAHIGFKEAWVMYLAGAFYGALLPSTVGTDAARAMMISRRTSLDIRVSAGSLVTLNLLGLGAVATVGTIAVGFLLLSDTSTFLILSFVLSGILAATVGLLMFTALGRRIIGLLSKATGLWPAAQRILGPLLEAVLVLPKGRRGQVTLVGIALVNQIIRISVAVLVASSFGLGIDWWVLAAIGPMVAIISMVPLSVLGVGIDQGASVLLLGQFGVAGSDAFAFSVTLSAMYIGLGLFGGIVVTLDSAFGLQKSSSTQSGNP